MDENSRRLYSAAQVRELERLAIAGGIAGYELMQRAAAACWTELQRRWPAARRIHVVCGSGNNGGDGFEIARLARAAGREVTVWQIGPPAANGDAVTARQAWCGEGGAVASLTAEALAGADVVVDALFGIGLTRDVAGEALAAIAAMNAARARGVGILAVDVPSGLDADTGKIRGSAVRADLTVTFIGRKPGLHTAAGVDCAGEVRWHGLSIPPTVLHSVPALGRLSHEHDLKSWLAARPRGAHKGRNGHVLLVGGESGMAGAVLLAGRGALRAGAGLVTVATRAAHATALTAAQPELMCHGVESAKELSALAEKADVIGVGPGLGQGVWGHAMLARLLESAAPLVVDADALNLLAREPARRDNWVLTPHPGEAARLLGIGNDAVQADRLAAVSAIRNRYGGIAVLKGAGSLIQGARLSLCPYGNPGMAVGGMGDVLTGVIAALIAQGLSLEDAAEAGVMIHALAGDGAARDGERGLLPSDLIAELRRRVNP